MNNLYGSDQTRPKAPAFTKLEAKVDIEERRKTRMAKGGLMAPSTVAELHSKRKGARRGRTDY